ncbi:MAG: hypothetical protein HY744_04380 [Deltaproteobacteria bacterium]|nr:hypothetical protein [Deltaproteobacteria bacterium]
MSWCSAWATAGTVGLEPVADASATQRRDRLARGPDRRRDRLARHAARRDEQQRALLLLRREPAALQAHAPRPLTLLRLHRRLRAGPCGRSRRRPSRPQLTLPLAEFPGGFAAGCGESEHVCCGQCKCADLKSDPNNCGLCGHKCGPGEICGMGSCVPWPP